MSAVCNHNDINMWLQPHKVGLITAEAFSFETKVIFNSTIGRCCCPGSSQGWMRKWWAAFHAVICFATRSLYHGILIFEIYSTLKNIVGLYTQFFQSTGCLERNIGFWRTFPCMQLQWHRAIKRQTFGWTNVDWVLCRLAPVPLTVFQSNSKFDQIWGALI